MAEKLMLEEDTSIDNWGENVDAEMPPWDEKTDGRDENQTTAEEIVLEEHEVILEDHDLVEGDALTDILEDQGMGEAQTITVESAGVLAVHQIQVKICWFPL